MVLTMAPAALANLPKKVVNLIAAPSPKHLRFMCGCLKRFAHSHPSGARLLQSSRMLSQDGMHPHSRRQNVDQT